jgi:hypothetical protein
VRCCSVNDAGNLAGFEICDTDVLHVELDLNAVLEIELDQIDDKVLLWVYED